MVFQALGIRCISRSHGPDNSKTWESKARHFWCETEIFESLGTYQRCIQWTAWSCTTRHNASCERPARRAWAACCQRRSNDLETSQSALPSEQLPVLVHRFGSGVTCSLGTIRSTSLQTYRNWRYWDCHSCSGLDFVDWWVANTQTIRIFFARRSARSVRNVQMLHDPRRPRRQDPGEKPCGWTDALEGLSGLSLSWCQLRFEKCSKAFHVHSHKNVLWDFTRC